MEAENRIIKNIIDKFILESELTEDQKETILQMYAPYDPEFHAYETDDRFEYEGKIYEVVQAHTSEPTYKPDQLKALYTLFKNLELEGVGVIPEWEQPAGTVGAYKKGDKVRYQGITYISTFEGLNVWKPTEYGWTKFVEG